MLTMEQIQALTPDEQREMTRQLGKAALKKFILMQTVKWAAIIYVTRSLRKALTEPADN